MKTKTRLNAKAMIAAPRSSMVRRCHAPHDLVKWKCESPADSPGLPARHVSTLTVFDTLTDCADDPHCSGGEMPRGVHVPRRPRRTAAYSGIRRAPFH